MHNTTAFPKHDEIRLGRGCLAWDSGLAIADDTKVRVGSTSDRSYISGLPDIDAGFSDVSFDCTPDVPHYTKLFWSGGICDDQQTTDFKSLQPASSAKPLASGAFKPRVINAAEAVEKAVLGPTTRSFSDDCKSRYDSIGFTNKTFSPVAFQAQQSIPVDSGSDDSGKYFCENAANTAAPGVLPPQSLPTIWPATMYEVGYAAEDVGRCVTFCEKTVGANYRFTCDLTNCDRSHSGCNDPTPATYGSLNFVYDLYVDRGASLDVLRMLQRQLLPMRTRTRFGFETICSPRLATGMPNTTFTNTMVNAACFTVGCMLGGLLPGEFSWAAFHGDDNIAYAHPRLHPSIAESFRAGGFIPKPESGGELCYVTYCSNAFWPTILDGAVGFVPAPTLKCWLKDYITTSDRNTENAMRQHRAGVAKGLIHAVSCVPILGRATQTIIDSTAKVHGKIVDELINLQHVKWMRGGDNPIIAQAYSFMAQRYGVSLSIIHHVEGLVSTMDQVGIYYDPLMTLLVQAVLAREG